MCLAYTNICTTHVKHHVECWKGVHVSDTYTRTVHICVASFATYGIRMYTFNVLRDPGARTRLDGVLLSPFVTASISTSTFTPSTTTVHFNLSGNSF